MEDTEQNIIYICKPSDNFYRELKRLRLQKNLTQKQLAQILKVGLTSIQSWENGRHFPNNFTCNRIISALSLTDEECSLLFAIKKNKTAAESAAEELPQSADEPQTAPPLSAESAEMGRQDDIPLPFPLSCHSEAAIAAEESPSFKLGDSSPSVRNDSIPLPSPRGEGGAAPAATDEERKTNAEASTEAAASVIPAKRPLIAILKEKWFQFRRPILIGVGIWFLECLALGVFLVLVWHEYTPVVKSPSSSLQIIIDPLECALIAITLFIVTVGISFLIYNIKKKVRKK